MQGFYNVMGVPPDLSQITNRLGETWEIMATTYKPYPCGFIVNPVLDCVLDWRRDNPESVVTRVVVRGNPLLASARIGRTSGPDAIAGKCATVIAAALVTGKAGVEQFSDACVRDPQVAALRAKVREIVAIPHSQPSRRTSMSRLRMARPTRCLSKRRAVARPTQ